MSINFETRLWGSSWSEEYDSVPLRLRLKMLHSGVSNPHHVDAGLAAASPHGKRKSMPDRIFEYQKEEGNLDSEMTQTTMTTSESPNHQALDSSPKFVSLVNVIADLAGSHGDFDLERTSTVSNIYSSKGPASEATDDVREEKVNNFVGHSLHQTSSNVGDGVLKGCLAVPTSTNLQATKVKHETVCEFDDDLDSVVLRERRRMLLLRKLMRSSGSQMEENKCGGFCITSKAMRVSANIEKQESDSIQDTQIAKSINPLAKGCNSQESKSGFDAVSVELRASPEFTECTSFGTQEITSTHTDAMASSVVPLIANVKDEPCDINDLICEGKDDMQNFSGSEMLIVKTEPAFSEVLRDELDHLPLLDRVKLLSSETPSMHMFDNLKLLKEDDDVGTGFFESVKPISISRSRKKRRTATCSVETALEEDAPGLLKVLVERGVLVEEIKLYGEEETDDDLDDSLSEDGFAELEAVISQLFSQRPTFLKFPVLRTKGAKISYCLSCLLSLVEQTRYLQNRKWPVEWGWCRDLQSFIFVFRRHNRIVLERPEYGFATYFFELLNSVPVSWQIKRLVTAMKLTSCGRITLIENKSLVVGDDLSEGEARVLAEYGWTPNTGLGTMLNYCDRVVHDRKQEMNSSEWRSKIGRQLIHGYNGGNLVTKNLPKKLIEYQGLQDVQVKLEQ